MSVISYIMSWTIKILSLISSDIQICKNSLKYALLSLAIELDISHQGLRVLEHGRIILILSWAMPVPLILILDIKHGDAHIFSYLNWTFRIFSYNLVSKLPASVDLTLLGSFRHHLHSTRNLHSDENGLSWNQVSLKLLLV